MDCLLPFLRKKKPIRWPFWLLVAAWCCANSPPRTAFEFFVWAGHGLHFSHQEQLKAEVAAMLGARKINPVVATSKAGPANLPAAPLPAEGVLKKIDLCLSKRMESIGPSTRELAYPDGFCRIRPRASPEPLLTPPKAAAQS
jgi:hypothetical protein